MADINLNDMPLNELKILEKNVAKAIKSFEGRRKKEALAALEAKAREFGFSSLSEVTGDATIKTVAPPKYRHPENPDITWSGRGRKPAWFNEAIGSGTQPEELLI